MIALPLSQVKAVDSPVFAEFPFCGIYVLPLFARFCGRRTGTRSLQLQFNWKERLTMQHQNAPPRANGHSIDHGHGLHPVASVANGRGTKDTTYYTFVLGIDA